MNNDSTSSLHVLVLAAGASTRLGQPKQLVRLDGRPLLHTMVSHAVSVAGHAVTVVLGAHAQQVALSLRHSSASIVINRQWEEGIGASIRAGISTLPPACGAVLLMLTDQVGITAYDLKRLIAAWQGRDSVIAASLYAGTVGVPAIFPRWCFSELGSLRGDRGAKLLLLRHRDRLVRVPMPQAAFDLDTPEQLLQLRQQRKLSEVIEPPPDPARGESADYSSGDGSQPSDGELSLSS